MNTSDMLAASEHYYPAAHLRGDYLRAFAGAAFCAFPFFVAPMHWIAAIILGSLTLLFASHGVRTWLRTMETVVMDDTGVTAGVLYRRQVAWQSLGQVRLRYFSTRRDRSGGWMQLVLRGNGVSVGIDSEIDGFVDICRSARDVARANGLDLSETTVRNFLAIGLDVTDLAPDSDVIARSGVDGSGKKQSWGSPAGWRR
ncbi:MAG: hypothetical protein VW644_03740 [Alphaproteobacteria bacterium]|jgi:hypothetical protein